MMVPDASVICKLYFLDEVHAELAEALANRNPRALKAPDLLLVEVGNSVARRVRNGEMSRAEGDIAMSDLRARFHRTVPAANLMAAAWKMSMTLEHHFSDCVYLALAVQKNGALVTADDRFLAKVFPSRWREFAVHLRDAAQ